jgi:ribosomal protein L11 methyltransferase
VPYRIDLHQAAPNAFDRVVDLGALDVEIDDRGTLSALMPDDVAAERVARAAGVEQGIVSPATGRDEGSVWLLRPRAVQVGPLRIGPADEPAAPHTIRLLDDAAFGTGLHPTTALCLEAVAGAAEAAMPEAVLDVGTGSGVLALAALALGVPRATALDVDAGAVATAAANARLNGLADRLTLVHGGPDAVSGVWPFVVANVLAAPLAEMAPTLARRVGHHGRLVLSGFQATLEAEVSLRYRHVGMRQVRVTARGGWVALWLQATW